MALKRPDAISFSKKNDIHPLDSQTTSSGSSSTASLEFWASKNDASIFVIGQTSKKRPNDLTFVRMFDGKVLDIVETGVENYVSMESIPVRIFFFAFMYELIAWIVTKIYTRS